MEKSRSMQNMRQWWFLCSFPPTAITLLLLLNYSRSVCGWGKDGHEVIANIAYARLSPKVREAVDSILGNADGSGGAVWKRHPHGHKNVTSPCSSSPLGKISDWADEVKHQRHDQWMEPLHIVRVDEDAYPDKCRAGSIDCRFVYERDCADDSCVAGAVSNYTTRLDNTYNHHHHNNVEFGSLVLSSDLRALGLRGAASSGASGDVENNADLEEEGTRRTSSAAAVGKTTRESLMFVTHFVGDIHQPLHVARTADRGGFKTPVKFSSSSLTTQDLDKGQVNDHALMLQHRNGCSGEESLHMVWDDCMIKRAVKDAYDNSLKDFCEYILDSLSTRYVEDVPRWLECRDGRSKGCTSAWAQESLFDALHFAYANEKTGKDLRKNEILSDGYYQSRLAVLERKLATAGVRLAAVLEDILGGSVDSEGMNRERATDPPPVATTG